MTATTSQNPGSLFPSGLSSLPRRAVRKAVREIRKVLAPSNIRRLRRKFVLPVRNVVSRHKPISASVAGHTIRLVPEGAIASGIWSGGDFEPAELALIARLLAPNSVFLDIGANVGVFSLLASKVCPSASIFAFEPAKETFDLLSRNIQLNRASNVTPLQLALGNFSGQATLHLNVPGKDGLNSLGKLSHPDTEAAGDETVPITTLDDYLRSASLAHIDLVKMDAEGAELMIFEGASSLLQRPNAPLFLYEAFSFLTRGFDYHPVEIFWLLERSGFSFFTLDSESGKLAIPKSSRAYDSMILAVKPSHPAYAKIEELAR
ncbi:MAG TPA: FkbM family methyltransferase [Candidatus Acidoferrum sp.]|nr:FkbM family methyltransferase [Candidatus Acidoferrum sp.]